MARLVLRCKRCPHRWMTRESENPVKPKVCPKCNSPFWNKPRRMKWAIDKARDKSK